MCYSWPGSGSIPDHAERIAQLSKAGLWLQDLHDSWMLMDADWHVLMCSHDFSRGVLIIFDMYVLIIQLWVDAPIPVFQALDLVAGYVKARLRETHRTQHGSSLPISSTKSCSPDPEISTFFRGIFLSKQSKSGSQKWGDIWEGFFCIPLCLNFKKKCFLA